MIALAVVIFLEKLWSRGWVLTRLVGVTFLLIAAIAVFKPAMLPALQPSTTMDGMTQPAPADQM